MWPKSRILGQKSVELTDLKLCLEMVLPESGICGLAAFNLCQGILDRVPLIRRAMRPPLVQPFCVPCRNAAWGR